MKDVNAYGRLIPGSETEKVINNATQKAMPHLAEMLDALPTDAGYFAMFVALDDLRTLMGEHMLIKNLHIRTLKNTFKEAK